MKQSSILWLGEQLCNDVLQVGAKAANLSQMFNNYRIPLGFSVTSSFFKKIENPSNIDIISDKLTAMVAEAYRQLEKKCHLKTPSVAVRSSAIDEDNIDASFAGQFKTLLNISGCENVVQAIIDCYQSAFSERVLTYRSQNQLTCSTAMSVLVQQMVPADMSSVVFSKNPINNNVNEIVINANWGLGESIVNGKVTPDTYIVNKHDLQVKEKIIAKKSIMSIHCPQEGIKDVEIPKVMYDTPVMTDQQIIENSDLVKQLENKFQVNVDIECAWKDENLYLLQCRPITTGN